MVRDLVKTQAEKFASFVEDWVSAWNAHSIDRVMSHYAEDVTVKSPFLALALPQSGGSVTGKAALTPIYAGAFKRYPDLKFELLGYFASTESVVIHYRSVNELIAAETFLVDDNHQAKLVLCHYNLG